MRTHFHERLQGIHSRVIVMGSQVTEMIRRSSEAIVQSNPMLAHEVIREDDVIDTAERDLMFETIRLVMQESPVASDLRFLVSTLGIIGEIEKVADDAVKLARRGLRLGSDFPGEMKYALSHLSEQSRNQFVYALRLYSEYSPDLARAIFDMEEVVDASYTNARKRVYELMKSDPSDPSRYVRTIEVFHALEHISDHSTSIATRLQLVYDQVSQPVNFSDSLSPDSAEPQPE